MNKSSIKHEASIITSIIFFIILAIFYLLLIVTFLFFWANIQDISIENDPSYAVLITFH